MASSSSASAAGHLVVNNTKWILQPHQTKMLANEAGTANGITALLPTMPVQLKDLASSTEPKGSPPVVEGSNPCVAEVATDSTKELRQKGSSFLRTHASKHGIPNASRKLTSQVLTELAQHYSVVHRVAMIEDDYMEHVVENTNNVQQAANRSKSKATKRKANGAAATAAAAATTEAITNSLPQLLPLLPQHPVPITVQQQMQLQQQHQQQQVILQQQLQQEQLRQQQQDQLRQQQQQEQLRQQQQQQQRQQQQQQLIGQMAALNGKSSKLAVKHTLLVPVSTPADWNNVSSNSDGGGNPRCTANILARTRSELATCGTSMLRPEAAAHKVHNASRKPKDIVIDELWHHYVSCHQKDLMATSTAEPGWVGNVIDEDEDSGRK